MRGGGGHKIEVLASGIIKPLHATAFISTLAANSLLTPVQNTFHSFVTFRPLIYFLHTKFQQNLSINTV